MDPTAFIQRTLDEAKRRLARAASLCANELKVTVSVPAPRKKSKRTGRLYAATPAVKGAPPRKLSGRGRGSIAWKMMTSPLASVVGTNVIYMPAHERRDHPWVKPTLARIRPQLDAILRGD